MKLGIIVLAKYPILGQVKTRLAATTGNDFALEAYQNLLTYTVSILPTNVDTFFFVTPQKIPWIDFEQELQTGNSLGDRLNNAVNHLKERGYDRFVLLGTDCAEIQTTHINQAMVLLHNNDVVIGPATDGGYYLLAFNETKEYLFEGMPWSESNLLESTISQINRNNHKYTLLDTLNDVDTWDDIKPHLQALKLGNPMQKGE